MGKRPLPNLPLTPVCRSGVHAAGGGQAGHSRTLCSHPPTLPNIHLPLNSPQVAAKLGTKPNFLGTLRVAPLFEMLEDL